MKIILKTTAMLLLVTVFTVSCKKSTDANSEYDAARDTTDMSADTIRPADSSAVLDSSQNGKTGTTGATGEGSTGSGTDGSTQKGNPNVRTDSIQK